MDLVKASPHIWYWLFCVTMFALGRSNCIRNKPNIIKSLIQLTWPWKLTWLLKINLTFENCIDLGKMTWTWKFDMALENWFDLGKMTWPCICHFPMLFSIMPLTNLLSYVCTYLFTNFLLQFAQFKFFL